MDSSKEMDEKTNSKDSIDLQSRPKAIVRSNADQNVSRVSVLYSDDTEANVSNAEDPNLNENGDLKAKFEHSDNSINVSSLEAQDLLLNPNVYQKYERSIDISEDFTDILAKQLDNVKDFARDRTVFSVSLGERGIIWTYKKIKSLSKKWFTYVFLLFLLLGYSVIGAVTFILLEGQNEAKFRFTLHANRKKLAEKLENIVKNETIMQSNPDLLTLIENDLIIYESNYSECMKNLKDNNTTEISWSFWNAMVFAGTIYTTIGYGNITPKTTAGQAATIIYAIIGIPLFLIVLATFGKLLTWVIKYFWVYITSFRKRRKLQTQVKFIKIGQKAEGKQDNVKVDSPPPPPEIEVDDEFNLPISFVILILILYMLCGAGVMVFLESWPFFQSFYFIFISMSTIGLGDYVSNHPVYVYISILYVIFGLALTGMCINVVQKKITAVLVKYEHLLIKESQNEQSLSANDQNENNPSVTHDT